MEAANGLMREQNSQQRAMPLSSEEDEFLEVASAALPRIIELIATFPIEDRTGAFEVAERRYIQAARDFGCSGEAATRWVAGNYAEIADTSGTKGDGARN